MVDRSDAPTLGERHAMELIAKEMAGRGFVEVQDKSATALAIVYQLSLGPGQMSINSSPNYSTGGTRVSSQTTYPRFLQIIVVDWKASEAQQKPVILWQSEVHSQGSTTDLSVLAGYLIPQAFKKFGQSVSNEMFFEPMTPGFR